MMKMLNDSFKKMNSNQRVIIKIALIGVLSALCYVAVMFSIPIPSPLGKPMLHFGNLRFEKDLIFLLHLIYLKLCIVV